MSDGNPGLLTATQFALLWICTGLLMLANTIGHWFDLWPMTGPVWWLALIGLVALSLAQTYDYVSRRESA